MFRIDRHVSELKRLRWELGDCRRTFEPRLPFELGKAGEFTSKTFFGGNFRASLSTRVRSRTGTTRVYVVECLNCGKRFPRKLQHPPASTQRPIRQRLLRAIRLHRLLAISENRSWALLPGSGTHLARCVVDKANPAHADWRWTTYGP